MQAIASDEAAVLRRALGPDVPVQANPNRIAGAAAVLGSHPQTTVLILDDGFQHRQVDRQLDLVLIDATSPFGGGRLLPMGLLREPLGSLRRADGLILTHADQVDEQALQSITKQLARKWCPQPIAATAHAWDGLLDEDDQQQPLATLQHEKLAALCGIGNPAQFKTMLAEHFNVIVAVYELADHQEYTPQLVQQLVDHAQSQNARALLMTEKDWVKWQPVAAGMGVTLPTYRPRLSLRFLAGSDELDALLRQVVEA